MPLKVLAGEVHGFALPGPLTHSLSELGAVFRTVSVFNLHELGTLTGVQAPIGWGALDALQHLPIALLALWQAPDRPGFNDSLWRADQDLRGVAAFRPPLLERLMALAGHLG